MRALVPRLAREMTSSKQWRNPATCQFCLMLARMFKCQWLLSKLTVENPTCNATAKDSVIAHHIREKMDRILTDTGLILHWCQFHVTVSALAGLGTVSKGGKGSKGLPHYHYKSSMSCSLVALDYFGLDASHACQTQDPEKKTMRRSLTCRSFAVGMRPHANPHAQDPASLQSL